MKRKKMTALDKLPLFRDFPELKDHLPHVSLATLPTPVEKIEELCSAVGIADLYVKRDDLSGSVYGSNKVRKLEFLLGEALKSHAREVITFGFAGSNHALATAIYANQLGLKSISLLMPQANAHYVRHNLLAGHHYKARLCNYGSLPLLLLGMMFQFCRSKVTLGKFPHIIPAGGSCPLGIIAYVNAAMELKDQVVAGVLPEPDFIYLPLGSMGTSAGLILGLKAVGLKTRVIPVRVIEERMASPARMLKLIRDTASFLCKFAPTFPHVTVSRDELLIRNDCLGAGYAQFTSEGVKAADMVRTSAGIILNGSYSAKAFSALMDDATKGILDGKKVLFWNTYNSRDLSTATGTVDYHDLPKAFHRYFEDEVQSLDRRSYDKP